MAILKFDDGKCIKCGACAVICPMHIIYYKKREAPKELPWTEKVCISCGHCVAVCPKEAVSVRDITPSGCTPIKEDLSCSPEAIKQFMTSRRSIRVFKDAPVERSAIEKAIDIARLAPTGHNRQPVKWLIIYDRDKVVSVKEKVIEWMRDLQENDPAKAEMLYVKGMLSACEKGMDVILRGAPHLVIAWASADEPTAEASCRISMTHFELAAHSLGIGCCWAGYLDIALKDYPPLQEMMGLPSGYRTYCSVMAGYPSFKYKRVPSRKAAEIIWK